MGKIKIALIALLISLGSLEVYAQSDLNQLDSNGKRTGKWEKKYNSGKVRYRGQFVSGQETGYFYFYTEYNQSKPYLVKHFQNGTNIAKVQFFSKSGVLVSAGNMRARDKTGKWLFYGSNGKSIVMEENYQHGKLSGLKKIFYKNGKLTEESYYRNGMLHGTSKRYTSSGKLITHIPYVNDKIHGKIFYYDNKGIIIETGHYDHGKRVGRWEFYIDGVLAGVTEPNKQKPRDTIKLKDLQARKAKKNPKKVIPKRIFTLEELKARKVKKDTKKIIPKRTFTLEELEARKKKRVKVKSKE